MSRHALREPERQLYIHDLYVFSGDRGTTFITDVNTGRRRRHSAGVPYRGSVPSAPETVSFRTSCLDGPDQTLDGGGNAVGRAAAMLDTYPADLGGVDRKALAACIEACFECAQACTACADACLSESQVADLVGCVRTDLDCADVCETTGRVLSRHTGYDANLTRAMLWACVAASRSCGDECERHASMHEHCRVCAEACRRCEQACKQLLDAIG
jgi:hypothetical protein